MSRALSLAGFEVTLIGRFWVTTEVLVDSTSGSSDVTTTDILCPANSRLKLMSRCSPICNLALFTTALLKPLTSMLTS
jgi:hypothetical protein